MQALVIIEAKGKVGVWKNALKDIGVNADVLATYGHIKAFASSLWPLGIAFDDGQVCDPGRVLDPSRFGYIRDRVLAAGEDVSIFIATDDDAEGDVIALDLIEALIGADRSIGKRIFRVKPSAMTVPHIKRAMETAEPLLKVSADVLSRALPGRTRAVTDRWIGAVFSREAGHPVGRVRTSLLGSFFLLGRAQQHLRARPEIGEIIIRARASAGGAPFIARVSLDGSIPKDRIERIARIAGAHAGRVAPGVVTSRRSLSAAVAPRIGSVRPFNTGDALAYAMRHFKLTGKQAMQGLQGAYLKGVISYPRTDSRDLCRESAVQVVRLAEACRFAGLDAEILSQDFGPSLADARRETSMKPAAHQAIHPVMPFDRAKIADFENIIRAPILFTDMSGSSAGEIEKLMIALVSRRCLEAARDIVIEAGDWRPDNERPVGPDEAMILSDLDWQREISPPFPWSKDLMTGVKHWPLRAILVDMMMQENLGRPSTYASHADMMEASGEIEHGDINTPPRPSPFGQKVLTKSPRALWLPATCRMVDDAIANSGPGRHDETGLPMQIRMKRRIASWLKNMPEDIQQKLIQGIQDPDSMGARGPSLKALAGISAERAQADPSLRDIDDCPHPDEPDPEKDLESGLERISL